MKLVYSICDSYAGYINDYDIVNEIYNLFKQSGYFYDFSREKSVSKAIYKEAQINKIIFCRGMKNDKLFVSGLGLYEYGNEDKNEIDKLKEIYSIENHISSTYDMIKKNYEWIECNSKTDFINIEVYVDGKWIKKRNLRDSCLIRKFDYKKREYDYYILQNESGKYYKIKIENWIIEERGIEDIENALLSIYGKLPDIEYRFENDLVYVKLKYPMPEKLMYFLKLYSWPVFYDRKSDFERMMKKDVFSAFMVIYEDYGLNFKNMNLSQ